MWDQANPLVFHLGLNWSNGKAMSPSSRPSPRHTILTYRTRQGFCTGRAATRACAKPLTWVHLQVHAVAEVCVAAVGVEVALGAQAIEGLSGRHQLFARDAVAHVLLHAIDHRGGGHARAVRLALEALLLAASNAAITQQGCREGRETVRNECK